MFTPKLFAALLFSSLNLTIEPIAEEQRFTSTLASEVVEIPMDRSDGQLGVEISIGEQGPFAFQLDTYAVTTACVDFEFAKQMGFEKVGTVMNGDGSGALRERDVVLIPELSFGDATFTNVRALVDDYTWVPSSTGGSINGLLGYHLFKELLLQIDFPRDRIVLRKGRLSAKGEHVISASAIKDRPDVPMLLGGKRHVFGIDTGAAASISMTRELSDQLQLTRDMQRIGTARTVYSSADVWSGTIAKPVQLAGHELKEIEGSFCELFRKPLIGNELLAPFAVTFDQRSGRIQFEKQPQEFAPK